MLGFPTKGVGTRKGRGKARRYMEKSMAHQPEGSTIGEREDGCGVALLH